MTCSINGVACRGMLFSPVLAVQRTAPNGNPILVLPNYCYPGHMNYEGSIQSIVFQDGPQPTVWGADNNGRARQMLLATS